VRRGVIVVVAVLAVGLPLLGSRAGAALQTLPAPPARLLPGQHAYSSIVGRVRVNYLLYAPSAYGKDRARRWPLIVFLHGGGERGDDPELLTRQPLPKTLAVSTSFPAVVVSPQLPLRFTYWSDLIDPVDALVQRLERRYAIDSRRIY
jgi:predicted peptidase